MKYELNPSYAKLKPLIENIEKYFQESTDVLHNERNEIRVVSFQDSKYVIKAFKIPNIINQFVYRYARPSKAKRSYLYSLKLGSDLSPEAIAYIEEHKKGLLSRSYYISKHFDYDFEIRALLYDDTFENRTQILEEFAIFTHQLHEIGVLHRDYSPGNILIKKQGNHYQFNIIDVNRMEFKVLSMDDRLSNFVRLSIDDATMKTILYQYAACIQQDPEDAFATAKAFSVEYERKRALKNKLRGR